MRVIVEEPEEALYGEGITFPAARRILVKMRLKKEREAGNVTRGCRDTVNERARLCDS